MTIDVLGWVVNTSTNARRHSTASRIVQSKAPWVLTACGRSDGTGFLTWFISVLNRQRKRPG